MAGYIGTVPVPQATETRDVYTATSSQTTFATGGYTPNFVSVYLNGVHLARADYTATNGTDVVLAVGAAADDTVEIVSFNTFEVSAHSQGMLLHQVVRSYLQVIQQQVMTQP